MLWWSVLLGALALAPATAHPQDVTPRPTLTQRRARFEGTWHLATERERAERIIDQACTEAANAMNFFIRGIARGRLRASTHLHTVLTLHFDGDELTVHFSDGDVFTTRLGRTESQRDHAGEMVRVTQRFQPGGELEQILEADGGTRRYIWTPAGEDRMRIDVITSSPQMPRAMRFTLEYERD